MIEHIRSTFYQNDLTEPLPLHALESRAMPFENYQLAYTPVLLRHIFGIRVNDALMTEGRFAHSEGDSNWWIRSGTTQFRKRNLSQCPKPLFHPDFLHRSLRLGDAK
ncbi:MAG: hypothetical protein IPI11_02280 [Haliscomenobacter sp.]|nr:hypothetical protein [Haliscomenobacter sp.]